MREGKIMGIYPLALISIAINTALIGIPAAIAFWYLKNAPVAGLLIGLISGVIFTLVALSRHIRCVKRLPYLNLPDTFDTFHKREITLHLPSDKAFTLCRKLVGLIEKTEILEEDNRHQASKYDKLYLEEGININYVRAFAQ